MMLSETMWEYSVIKSYHHLGEHQPNVKVMALASAQANVWLAALTTILVGVFFFFSFWGSLLWRTLAGG
jgi:hypothetical protein